jgi:hypothetical protein
MVNVWQVPTGSSLLQQLHDSVGIQRDYAQGRQGEAVGRIRANFLDAICSAVLAEGKYIGLDFVFGDVEVDKFYPLDGQQRLTTLFLLHWYLACRAAVPNRSKMVVYHVGSHTIVTHFLAKIE